MAQAKRIYILRIKVNKLFSFLSWCFLKEIESIAHLVFIEYSLNLLDSFYQVNVKEIPRKVWENSKRLWKCLPVGSVPTAFLILLNFYSCICLYSLIETLNKGAAF